MITPRLINITKMIEMITPITVKKLNTILILFLFPVEASINATPARNKIAPNICKKLGMEDIRIDNIIIIAPNISPIPEKYVNLFFIFTHPIIYYTIKFIIT